MLRTAMVPIEAIQPPILGRVRRGTGRLVLERTTGGWYHVIDGHQAYEKAVRTKQDHVPCLVREDRGEGPADLLAEHICIGGLCPLEEARAIQELMDRWGVSQRQLTQRIGVSQPYISKRLRLLDLPLRDQAMLSDGLITLDEALMRARGLQQAS